MPRFTPRRMRRARVAALALAALLAAGCEGAGLGAGHVVPLEARFGAAGRARGSAVLLPGGHLLTAAHVVDEASVAEALCRRGRAGEAPPGLSGVVARLAGGPVPATRLGLGRSHFVPQGCELAYRDGADLALLRLEAPAGPAIAPCEDDAVPGRAVVVATVARHFATRIAGIAAEPVVANGSYAVLADRLETGDSGGGVFDAATGCLLGIVSQRDPRDPDRVWVVRTSVIREFLAKVTPD